MGARARGGGPPAAQVLPAHRGRGAGGPRGYAAGSPDRTAARGPSWTGRAIMTGQKRVQRLADWLIRRSGRRLPDGTREERLREWTAELTAILDDAGITRLRRKARAIRFS